MTEEEKIFTIKLVAVVIIITAAVIIAGLLIACMWESVKLIMNMPRQSNQLISSRPLLLTLCAIILPCSAGVLSAITLWRQLKRIIEL